MSSGSTASAPTPILAPGRRRLFTVLMLLIPVVFFAGIEGCLRVTGYGSDYPLFETASGYPSYRVQTRDVARRYFARQATVPDGQYDYFTATKAPGTIRVFVQGGSSAAGFPFYRGGTFSRMLEQRLQETFPGRPVEVVNTAMSAVNSYTLRDLADEIVAQEPDVVLIYAGHNEYYGALGVASAESLGRQRWLVNTYLALQRLRLVQALRAGIGRLASGRAATPTDGSLMARMIGEQQVPLGSDLYDAGLDQWRGNLDDLLATYQRAGIPVYIGTVASNERDHAPFLTVHTAGVDTLRWQALVTEGRQALDAGDAATARARFEAATQLDPLAAAAYFHLGHAYEQLGQVEAARTAYQQASDRDALRFRAPRAVNQIIREVAAQRGAHLVDTEAALRRQSPQGLLGHEMILEHLHPTLDGYFWIADAFYEALRADQRFGVWTQAVPAEVALRDPLYTEIDSLMGYFRLQQLLNNWPFQPLGRARTTTDTIQVRTRAEQLALDVYTDRTTWNTGQNALATYYQQQGELLKALRICRAVVQEYPMVPDAYTNTAHVLVGLGAQTGEAHWKDEAMAYYQAAFDLDPRDGVVLGMIGAIKLERNDVAGALPILERAASLAPRHVQTLYNLSGAYALSGRYAESRRIVLQVLQLNPNHPGARQLYGSLPPG